MFEGREKKRLEGSRLPKEFWEQMLPKKLPAPSSSPSRGTNSVSTTSSSTAFKTDHNLPSSDGKV
ncbi:glutamate-gated kainate-type ion channel receptor subunit GluR5 [Senna tora]|uniref:Glutamate-gated kainate-type ion channel receptor subunit GluR5 n=1 Tax=Senna tora TaxID=362788 RepID=A0A834U0Z7_9FABA|nr:glutamate-gated kainate-type ion channel receptor subunit GluR5 [Senna tora]